MRTYFGNFFNFGVGISTILNILDNLKKTLFPVFNRFVNITADMLKNKV